MIAIRAEPEGLLLKKADILAWADGLSEAEWNKIRPHLTPVFLPGVAKPYYRKTEVRRKLIQPIEENNT